MPIGAGILDFRLQKRHVRTFFSEPPAESDFVAAAHGARAGGERWTFARGSRTQGRLRGLRG
eukprot:13002158-Alexandrium_andersonii.AAC.1